MTKTEGPSLLNLSNDGCKRLIDMPIPFGLVDFVSFYMKTLAQSSI